MDSVAVLSILTPTGMIVILAYLGYKLHILTKSDEIRDW